MKLWTTGAYDALSWQEIAERVNGCGPGRCSYCRKFLNKALGRRVFDACAQHDIDYGIGGGKTEKREADVRLICNLIVIALSKPSLWNYLRVPYLFIYYIAVHYGGKRFFNWMDIE